MEKPEANPKQEYTLTWIEECLTISRRKALALQRNDLAELEECLEQAAQILSRRPIFHKTRLQIPTSIVSELRSANKSNRALVANGLDLTRTLLNTIRPPATYSLPSAAGVAAVVSNPVISVKC